jgi:DNA helicase-2/ATP-dependent DNA helicase PcrA
MFTPSPLQQSIFDFALANEANVKQSIPRRSLIVDAKAGSGKSTTALELMKLLSRHGLSMAYTTFNTAPKDEFKLRVQDAKLPVSVESAHAFGRRALANSGCKCLCNEKGRFGKVSTTISRLLDTLDPKHPLLQYTTVISTLVNYAKDAGIGLASCADISDASAWHSIIEHHQLECEGYEELVVEYAQETLRRSNAEKDIIDFADMLYLPLLRGCQFEQYDYLFIDEAQDTNTVRRMMFKKMLKPWGCAIIIGDPYQAIYGFTGADNDSMQLFEAMFNTTSLPLSVCYRCDKAIIKEAQKIVPEIQWREGAPEGIYRSMDYKLISTLTLTGDDAVLCRYNAPNVKLCFSLLRAGIPCRIEGRDIGFGLIKLIERLGGATVLELQANVETYRNIEIEKADRKDDPQRAELIHDKCDMLQVLIEAALINRRSINDVKEKILDMFSDAKDRNTPRNILTLSSIHKAKGREWDRVLLLGRAQYMPSKYAKQEWQKEQEANLTYVAITRAKHELIEVTNVP